MLNIDCTTFFHTQHIPNGKAGETIDRYVDLLADWGVKTLLCNTNARRTNYRSDVWDAWWDGYDPDGPDDQPFFAAIKPEQAKKRRKTLDAMLAVHRQGIDYPARFFQRCRRRGVSPWISLRMNDCHNANNPGDPFHGEFWKKNPRYCIDPKDNYFGRCLDYARTEVRDYYKTLVVETLDRYDIDGLELDFMREPFLFRDGREEEGGAILAEWLRGVRKLVDAAARRREHPIRLGVRVPSRPETAKAMGLDAVGWAKEGLIDLIVPTPRWATIEFDIPMERWRELLTGTNVALAGGLEILYRPHGRLKPRPATPELAAGAAAAVLSRGADAVYLFNYFPDDPSGWPRPVYKSTLRAMNSLDRLLKLPRSVGLTYRDIRASGEKYRPPLPAEGKKVALSIDVGPLPDGNWDCILSIAEKTSKVTSSSRPAARLNDCPCRYLDSETKDGFRVSYYLMPSAAFTVGNSQKITIDEGGRPLKIERLEVSFCARSD
ncbi:MAG: hypothetical protein JW959_08420 [Pirellulales bacterium]|nr:hypothetical protein [Pirellulales bacterium]